MSPIHIALRAARENAAMTQQELAAKASVQQATISNIENGKTVRIELALLERLCRALRVSPGELLVLAPPARKRK